MRGGSIFYTPGLKTKRLLWVSADFSARAPQISSILRTALESAANVKLLGSYAEYEEETARRTRGPMRLRRPMEVLALVTKDERRRLGHGRRNFLTAKDFITFMTGIDDAA